MYGHQTGMNVKYCVPPDNYAYTMPIRKSPIIQLLVRYQDLQFFKLISLLLRLDILM